MKTAILLEPDRVLAKCISSELLKLDIQTLVATNANQAIGLADKNKPDVVISEIAVSNHSGTEFLYEFRTYTDWKNVPIIIFSSVKPQAEVINSHDFKMLNISDVLYKPESSLKSLCSSVLAAL